MATEGPVLPTDRGVTVAVQVMPRARRQRIEGIVTGADGKPAIKVAVTAPPEGGKANAATIALLARSWGVPKRSIAVRAGAAARRKLLAVAGDPAELKRRIEDSLKELSDG